MASGDDFAATFKVFATKADGKEATTKDINKWLTDAGCLSKNVTTQAVDIAFCKCKTKGKNTITCEQCKALFDDVFKANKEAMLGKLTGARPKAHGATKQSKTGGVDKMTDASKYTGSHKERFGEDGKGKGKEGRVDQVDDSGYVGNYKGDGSFDKKK